MLIRIAGYIFLIISDLYKENKKYVIPFTHIKVAFFLFCPRKQCVTILELSRSQ